MKINVILLFSFLVVLGGCTSVKTSQEPSWLNSDQEFAKLLVFRGDERAKSRVVAGIGSMENFVVSLKSREYSVLAIPVGQHNLRVGDGVSKPHEISVTLSSNMITCMQVKGNAAQSIGALVPIIAFVIPTFTAEEVECPSESLLATYTKV